MSSAASPPRIINIFEVFMLEMVATRGLFYAIIELIYDS
jgi:hypothetical protein